MILDQETLKGVISFDYETGVFTRLSNGKAAGSTNKNGYRYITIQNNRYLAHRLAWLYVHGEWPPADVDHIDGCRANNAIGNLRLATRAQNLWNSKIGKNNTSGYKGVHYHRGMKKWRARITVDRREIFLGHFDNPKSAHAAYVAAATEYYGEFARPA